MMLPSHLCRNAMVVILSVWFLAVSPLSAIPVDNGPGFTQAYLDTSSPDVLGAWLFYPRYCLPGSAGALPMPPLQSVTPERFEIQPEPILFKGQRPSQRFMDLLGPDKLPRNQFTVEMWINDHISESIALMVTARDRQQTDTGWRLTYRSLGYADRAMAFEASLTDGATLTADYANQEKDGFKEYWRHVVVVYDGKTAKLYVNGSLKAQSSAAPAGIQYTACSFLEVDGYLANEPYMEIAHILSSVRLHDKALTQAQIQQRFELLCRQVENGWIFPVFFHFNTAPYLSFVTKDSASLVWETSFPSKSTIRWGRSVPLRNVKAFDTFETIQKITLNGLEAATPYFYQVQTTTADGQSLDSGVLSFQTAVQENQPFRFAVVGDTETRPHINQQLSRMIWDQRPSFLINVGDLTDGGKQSDKFQWNYEYFQGMLPLLSRVPVFAVPGNAEEDLYWFRRYHALPGDKMPYTFTYGNAQFFMLDSNLRQAEFVPGGRQYEWLKAQLEACDKEWTFVAFHHAPYTSEEDDYGNSWKEPSSQGDPLVRPLVELFEAYHVDIVMFGHLHLYERTYPILKNRYNPNGTVYLLCGGGGGNLEDFAPNPAYFTAHTHRGHHFCMLEIIHNRLTLEMFDLDGTLKDSVTIEK